MRLFVVLACVIAPSGIAHADEFPEYPQEYTDRPIVSPRYMTQFGFSLDLPSSSITTVDMGTTTTKRTGLGDSVLPDLELIQSFGRVEVEVGAASTLHAGANVQLGDLPAKAFVGFQYFPSLGSVRYYYSEYAGVAYKALVEPKRFSVYTSASVGAIQFAREGTMDLPASSGRISSASARVIAEVQLTHRLALLVDPGITVGLSNSSTTAFPTELQIGTELVLALGRWDLYSYLEISDLTDRRLPFVSTGATVRW